MSLQEIFSTLAWPNRRFQASVCEVLGRARKVGFFRAILKNRVWFIASFQAFLILAGLLVAWLLGSNFELPGARIFLTFASILIAIRLFGISQFGLLHGWWRYTGVGDAVNIVKATLAGSFGFLFCVRLVLNDRTFPLAVYLLEPLLSILFLSGSRIFSRIIAESSQNQAIQTQKIILIGAGAAAHATLRELTLTGSGYRAIGCVDDDLSKLGVRLEGVPVLGPIDILPRLAKKKSIREVLIAIPSATQDQMQRIAQICESAQLSFKSVPSIRGFLNGRIDLAPFHDACMENLLGRSPVEIDAHQVRKKFEGQTILITGAAGTIGSELCRQVLQLGPARLLCADRNETGMFYLKMELSARARGSQSNFFVTDFGDAERMRNIFGEHRPGVVFHAAAYKHVPMMETNVYDAVKNNVFSLRQLMNIAESYDCSTFVLISSDKAVNPVNIMGATKRVGERMIACRPEGRMRCVSVRFGNVLGSNGSVVKIFQEQLRDHRPLTITHPEVTRFFMTTKEAVSLVLQAFAIGKHGDTLLLEMGNPVRILDLAKKLIQISGRSEKEVAIRFTGLREGEKLFEELSYPDEKILTTTSLKIGRIAGTPQDWFELNCQLLQLHNAMHAGNEDLIREKVKKIAPEKSPGRVNGIQRFEDQLPAKVSTSEILHSAISVNQTLPQNS